MEDYPFYCPTCGVLAHTKNGIHRCVKYLNPKDIINKRQTKTPLNRSRTGYGSKLPTSWQLQLDDKRWRRVYVVCWSNSGSAYIITKQGKLFLGSYDPNFD